MNGSTPREREIQSGKDMVKSLFLILIIVPVLLLAKWTVASMFYPRAIGQTGDTYGLIAMAPVWLYMMVFLVKGTLRGFRAFLHRSKRTLNLCRITLLVSLAVLCAVFLFSFFHNRAPFYGKGAAGSVKNAFRVARDNRAMISVLPLGLSDKEKQLVGDSLSKYSDPSAFAASNIKVSHKMKKKNKWSKPVKTEVVTRTAAGEAVLKAASRIVGLSLTTAEMALCVFFICLVKLLYYGHWWRAAFKHAFKAVHVYYFRNVLEIAFTSGGKERLENILSEVQAESDAEQAERRAGLIAAHPELAEIMKEAMDLAEEANRILEQGR
ncbi:MAG: hypothetical protein WDK95_13645 [Syntrophorhabdaceae bacterium]